MATYTTRNSLTKPGYADDADIAVINTNYDTIDASFAKCNWAGAAAPVVGDDSADGYSVGSIWLDATNHNVYLCEDASAGAAKWRLQALHNNFSATTNPGSGDDIGDGYAPGSIWYNITGDSIWMCKSASVGAAVWKSMSGSLNNLGAATAPTANDDSGDGYSVGSLWLDTTNNYLYIAKDVTPTAAIWLKQAPHNKYDGTTAPVVGDDIADGFAPGSLWYDMTANIIYTCESAAAGAAVWHAMPMKHKLDATTAPVVGDDVADGFSVGSIWVDTTNHYSYICESAAAGAALWRRIISGNASGELLANWDAGGYEIRSSTFQSDVTTGTAPFTVASTTKVTSLNADQLDSLHDTDFLKQSLADAKGDLIVASGDNAWARLAVGTNGKVLTADSTATNGITWSPASKGGINFITNPDFETDAAAAVPAGYATYADAAGTAPVNGTGGSPTVTLKASTTVILNGTKSARFAKDAANRQGEGWSYDMTIPTGWATRVVKASFYYYTDATIATGDYVVYFYDVTNSALIQPAPYQVPGTVASMPQQFNCYVQVPAACTSLRLIFHTATTSTTAHNIDIDEVTVGPDQVCNTPVMTDWTSWTPTGAWSTNTTYTGYWRRVGDTGEYLVKISLAGAPTSATLTVNMPSGHVIDSTKANTAQYGVIGSLDILDSGTYSRQLSVVYYNNTTSVGAGCDYADGTWHNITEAVPITFANGDAILMQWKVPISGWSSSTISSSDTDNRVCEGSLYLTGKNQTITAGGGTTEVVLNTVRKDTHAACNTSTGRFTCPLPGIYRVSYNIRLIMGATAATNASVRIFKNGTGDDRAAWYQTSFTNSATYTASGTCEIDCVAGDYISIWAVATGQNIDVGYTASSNDNSYMYVSRISGPSVVQAAEKVYAVYSSNAGNALKNNTATICDYEDKVVDSHNAVTTGASWKFTAPRAGMYTISTYLALNSAPSAFDGTTERFAATMYINGISIWNIGNLRPVATSNYPTIWGTTSYYLNAGDYMQIYAFQNSGSDDAYLTTGGSVWITITSNGGY